MNKISNFESHNIESTIKDILLPLSDDGFIVEVIANKYRNMTLPSYFINCICDSEKNILEYKTDIQSLLAFMSGTHNLIHFLAVDKFIESDNEITSDQKINDQDIIHWKYFNKKMFNKLILTFIPK